MPNVPIAGPRRARPPVLPREPAARPAAPQAQSAPTPSAPGSARVLPPLDYDESGRLSRPKALEVTRPGRRRRSSRVLWFVLGIAFGAVAAVFARGDALGTLHAARAWGASTLRSLAHKAAPAATGSPYSMATVTATQAPAVPAVAKFEPCPVEPGPGDPCAELLAPFAANVLTVSVDDLPKVKPPPPVVVIARRHGRAPAPSSAQPPATEESADTEPTPVGVNPDQDEPQARPTRIAPTSAPPAERPAAPEPPVDQKSAKNERT